MRFLRKIRSVAGTPDFLILSLLVVVLCVIVLVERHFECTWSRDSIMYLQHSAVYLEKGSFAGVLEYNPDYPFPPFSIGIIWLLALVFELETAGLLSVLIPGCGAIVLVYFLTRLLGGSRPMALGAAVLTTMNPGIIYMSTEPTRDMPFVFWSLAAATAFTAAVKLSKPYCFALCGAFAALALCFRHEGIEIAVLMTVFWLWMSWRERRSFRKHSRDYLLFLLSWVLTFTVLLSLFGMLKHSVVYYCDYQQNKLQDFLEE
jgi:4-amino-4-deoxy-L-arabinose transferase-like glycosyltransferase